jgi:uncharacterized protein DUF4232
MSVSSRPVGRRRTVGVVCCVMAAVATVSSGAWAHTAAPASAARCTTAHLEIWLGLGEGGGTLGSVYYPLEFSNVGHHACTLNGYPGVSGFRTGGGQAGPGASRNGQPHATVTLAPGATAHAILRVVDAGALCSSPVTAVGLKVFPPGARRSQSIDFSFAACPHSGVLIVGPVRAGVGIPGFTTS